MDGGNCSLAACQNTRNNSVFSIFEVQDLSFVIGWDSTHVVMDCGHNGSGLLGHIDVGEDLSGLGNTGKPFVEDLGVQMVEMKIDVILFGSDTSAFKNFHSHCSTDDVSGGQILS